MSWISKYRLYLFMSWIIIGYSLYLFMSWIIIKHVYSTQYSWISLYSSLALVGRMWPPGPRRSQKRRRDRHLAQRHLHRHLHLELLDGLLSDPACHAVQPSSQCETASREMKGTASDLSGSSRRVEMLLFGAVFYRYPIFGAVFYRYPIFGAVFYRYQI